MMKVWPVVFVASRCSCWAAAFLRKPKRTVGGTQAPERIGAPKLVFSFWAARTSGNWLRHSGVHPRRSSFEGQPPERASARQYTRWGSFLFAVSTLIFNPI